MINSPNRMNFNKALHKKRILYTIVLVGFILSIICVCSVMLRTMPKGIHIYQKEGKFGIKDGNSVLVPAKYLNIEFVDSTLNIALLQDKGNMYQDTSFFIYDVAKREFLFNDSDLYSISKVEKLKTGAYKLVLPGGRWFATLNLPDNNNEIKDSTIIPHFYDSRVSLRDFIINGTGDFMMHTHSTWADMKKSSPRAFRMMERILAMSSEESSPYNDLTFAQAVEYFIEEDLRYIGNYDLALGEIKDMIRALDNDGRDDMTQYGEIERILSTVNLSRSYIQMITDYPIYHKEYIAWHNLIEVMARYYNFIVYDDWSYQKQRDADLLIGSWMDNRRSQLFDERQILMGKKIISKNKNSFKTENDIRELCMEYYPSTPGCYDLMWHELYYAFKEWMEERKSISRTLTNEESILFDNYTSTVIDGLYNIIQSHFISFPI